MQEDRIVFAPPAFAPYAYRLFAAADPERNWRGVVSTGYVILARAGDDPLGEARSAGLPPAYVAVDRATGALLPPADVQAAGANFTAEAAQVFWRVALDARWNGDARPQLPRRPDVPRRRVGPQGPPRRRVCSQRPRHRRR